MNQRSLTETIIHWLPAHIGVTDHDLANKAAEDATHAFEINKISIEEIINMVRSLSRLHWEATFHEIT